MSDQQKLILSLAKEGVASMSELNGYYCEPRIEISRFDAFPLDGPQLPTPYVRVEGYVHFRFDPDDPHNSQIVDLGLAPRDGDGKVCVSSRFILLRPRDDKDFDETLVYEVNNRGNVVIANQAGDTDASNSISLASDVGNGFLFNSGWAWLWSAWSWDVAPGVDALAIEPPPVVSSEPLLGPVVYEFIVDTPCDTASFVGINARGYSPASTADENTTLNWRDSEDVRHLVPRDHWEFLLREDGTSMGQVRLKTLFEPGTNYELRFIAKDPVVAGVGPILVRDLLHHVKQNGIGGLRPPTTTIIEGVSQSGRFIHDMLHHGLHVRDGNIVFDAAMIIVSGSGKGGFNSRFVQQTRTQSALEENQYPSDYFPFSPGVSSDPASNRRMGTLDQARTMGVLPKLFFINTSVEYWTRGAALVHTDPTGSLDLELPDDVRYYHIAGGQHYPLREATWQSVAQAPNPFDHLQAVRALFRTLAAWTQSQAEPPASRYPRIADGTLIHVEDYRTEMVPLRGVEVPKRNMRPRRLNYGPRFGHEGIMDYCPPKEGYVYTALVPRADRDGIDLGGYRPPEIAAPLGTYLGWNRRHPEAGRADMCARFDGSFIPFAVDERARTVAGDPRTSLAARYGSLPGYLERLGIAIETAVEERFLLEEERDTILARGEALWELIHSGAPGSTFPKELKARAVRRSFLPDYPVPL